MPTTTTHLQYEITKPILSKPAYGWSSFTMQSFQGSLSYVDDVPNLILDAILEYDKKKSCNISFDEEGSEFHILIKPYITFIIHETDEAKLYAYDVNAEELLKRLTDDLEENLNEWTHFNILADENDPDYQKEYRQKYKELKQKLTKIKNLRKTKTK